MTGWGLITFHCTTGMHPPGVPPQQFVHPAQHAEQQNFQSRHPVGIANAPPPPPPGKFSTMIGHKFRHLDMWI